MSLKFKKKNKPVKTPETIEEKLEAGIDEEESGNRWLKGDPEKAIRFYNRAAEYYYGALNSNRSDNEINNLNNTNNTNDLYDAAYNIARIRFQIYLSQPPWNRKNIHSRIQELREIGVLHENAGLLLKEKSLKNEDIIVDLEFNTAQVLVALAEELFEEGSLDAENEGIRIIKTSCDIFQKILNYQLEVYKKHNEIVNVRENLENQYTINDKELKVYAEENITIEKLIDTFICIIDSFALLSAYNKTLEIEVLTLINNLYAKIFDSTPNSTIYLMEIQPKIAIRVEIPIRHLKSSFILSNFQLSTTNNDNGSNTVDALTLLKNIWDPLTNPETLIKLINTCSSVSICKLLFAEIDAYIGLAEDLHNKGNDSGTWYVYSEVAKELKSKFQLHLNFFNPKNDKLKSISRLWVLRGDIELLRANLNYSIAEKNKIILQKNASVYYKNAINLYPPLVSFLNSTNTQKNLHDLGTVEEIDEDEDGSCILNSKEEAIVKLGVLNKDWKKVRSTKGWEIVIQKSAEEAIFAKQDIEF